MATLNIPLSEPLKQFVDEEVREGGYVRAHATRTARAVCA